MRTLDKETVARVLADVATAQDFQSLGLENVVAIKSDPETLQVRQSVAKRMPRIDEENRKTSLEVSNDVMDRSGDRMRTRGIDLSEFKRNPIHLFDHRTDDPSYVMGRVDKITKGKETGPDRTSLTHDVRWLPFDVNPKADMVFRMQAEGVLVASSVRFRPIKANRPKTQRERERLGIGEFGVDFEKVYLLESSTVAIPDNQLAMAKSVIDRWADQGTYSWGALSDLEKALQPDTRTVHAVGGLPKESDTVEIDDQLTDEETRKSFLDQIEEAALRGTTKALEQHSAKDDGAGGEDGGDASQETPAETDASKSADPLAPFRSLLSQD